MKHFLPGLIALTLWWSDPSFGGTTGSLEGFVKDKTTGEPLVGANVSLVQTKQGTTTDARGFFKIHNIRAGSYDVRISMIGFQTTTSKEIVILPDRRSQLKAMLVESPIEMKAVEVTVERPLIQTDITGTAYEIDADILIKLPVDNIQQVVGLQPGTTAEGNIRGGKTRETIYLINGLPVQDVIQGGLGAEIPLSAILQMSVKTGGFDAEYGNALSGVVNVITRTGAQDHEVSLRAVRDDLFGGTEVSRRREVELYASGPIRRGLLSYLSASNLVLTDTRWWQDMQHFFDSPVRKELSGLGKIDYLISPTRRLTGEVLYSLQRWRDYEFTWRYNLDGLPSRRRDSYRAAVLWSHSVSSHLFYSASLSQFSLHSKIGKGSAQDMSLTPYDFDFFLLYITTGDRTWRADARQKVYTLKADVTNQIRTSHLVKAGFELNQYDIDSDLVKMEPQTTYFGKPLVFEPLLNYSNQYHYYPRSGSAYIQDKIEAGAATGHRAGSYRGWRIQRGGDRPCAGTGQVPHQPENRCLFSADRPELLLRQLRPLRAVSSIRLSVFRVEQRQYQRWGHGPEGKSRPAGRAHPGLGNQRALRFRLGCSWLGGVLQQGHARSDRYQDFCADE